MTVSTCLLGCCLFNLKTAVLWGNTDVFWVILVGKECEKEIFQKKCEREVSSGAVVWEGTQAGNPWFRCVCKLFYLLRLNSSHWHVNTGIKHWIEMHVSYRIPGSRSFGAGYSSDSLYSQQCLRRRLWLFSCVSSHSSCVLPRVLSS